MKRVLLFLPYFVASIAVLAATILPPNELGKAIGLVELLSIAFCWLTVPILSRRSLALGYAALLFPILLIGIVMLFGPKIYESEASVRIYRK